MCFRARCYLIKFIQAAVVCLEIGVGGKFVIVLCRVFRAAHHARFLIVADSFLKETRNTTVTHCTPNV